MSSEARNKLRATILATKRPQTKLIDFLGGKIELKQITLADVVKAARDVQEEALDEQTAMIKMLIDYAYVPGTNEKVFEIADRDALLAQPFGADFVRVSEAIRDLTSVDFNAPKPPSKETTSPSQ